MITARMTASATTSPTTQDIILVNMPTAVVGGGACGCGVTGAGTGVAAGVATGVPEEASGWMNRAKKQRSETCAVTVPVVASKVVGWSRQVPDFWSNDFTE